MKAMLLAAGFGTRMQPITLSRPKALVEVGEKTLLQRNIEYLKQAGINEIVINVHHFAQQIVDFVANNHQFGIKIHISDETDAVLETGGGLKRAQIFLQGDAPFVLMNVDILTHLSLPSLIQAHYSSENALATLAVTDRKSSRKLLFDATNALQGWRNDNTGEQILVDENASSLTEKSFSGIHVISPRIFDLLTQEGKFSIIPAYLSLAQHHLIKGFDHSHDVLLDVGKPEMISVAEKLFP